MRHRGIRNVHLDSTLITLKWDPELKIATVNQLNTKGK